MGAARGQFASSPQLAGELENHDRTPVTVRSNARESFLVFQLADYAPRRFSGHSLNSPSTPVSDLERMIHNAIQSAAGRNHITAGHSLNSPNRRNSPQLASEVGGPTRQRAS